ncbi:hypothetical protein Godav_012306 [Gossypium davidsonii]|uniref:Uncharacterized protein n=2 Tax=Gossypium TaxID=3633 RepID=A0A7J8RCV6_GOSDV|nr:hypothetical protein [Gossypium davidsonii]MBA0646760.1 hypothetical protein [Gossypium klotzschianum]
MKSSSSLIILKPLLLLTIENLKDQTLF